MTDNVIDKIGVIKMYTTELEQKLYKLKYEFCTAILNKSDDIIIDKMQDNIEKLEQQLREQESNCEAELMEE